MPLSVWKGHLRNEATDATPAVLHCPGKRQPSMPFQDQRCLESRANLDPNWLRPSILNCAEVGGSGERNKRLREATAEAEKAPFKEAETEGALEAPRVLSSPAARKQ